MKYLRRFEDSDFDMLQQYNYKIGEYVMYNNKEKFGDRLKDKPELAQVIDKANYYLYIRILEDGDELFAEFSEVRKLEPWESDSLKYNL
jgi:hypothetical protein